ncbi:hypothetical protein [Kitasatospora sp. NPDC058218]|uniref:hypothetical protein n=1 Tax=Kitasatospora sp. NPDC058218 TaxID=3346385 RepID=UPI0036D8DB26
MISRSYRDTAGAAPVITRQPAGGGREAGVPVAADDGHGVNAAAPRGVPGEPVRPAR